ncbi:MAG: oxygenase MpaB family protein [Propionibacteriales bacterium]|nr:oxygenase MpaB family protein [Propionibacteriales bacterium]
MTLSDVPARTLATLAAPVRRGLGQTLRARVAGDDATAKAAEIWGAEGPRWFTEQDPVWRVHADASMFVGGIRALLLQSLHPLAMAGVAGHSGFRSDPWGRLERTSTFLATTTFGTIDHAEATIARVRSIHERVRGTAPDGRPYAASDPHLLDWVHLAEVDSFLTAFQRFGPGPLSSAEADQYVRQSGEVASRLGATAPPVTVAELQARLEGFRPELGATEAARDVARFLILNPPLPVLARPGYGMLVAGAVASLPSWARRELRLPPAFFAWDWPGQQVGNLGAGVIRWAMGDPSLEADRRSGQPGSA